MKVLIIGPFFPPVSGVSTANETLLQGLSEYLQVDSINMGYPEHSEDLGKFSIKKAIRAMRSYWHIHKVALSDVVYMTPGQTFYGILKYSPFILFSKLLGKKAIVHVHGDHVWREFDELKGIKKKAYSTTLSLFDEGIVLSESLRKNLRPFLPEQNISVINNINNAIYGMTGGQLAPTTLPGQKTTSSPSGRDVEQTGFPIRMAEILATLDGAGYIVRRSLHDPKHIRQSKKAIRLAFETQQRGLGFSMVELLSSCPTNWGMNPVESLRWIEEYMVPVFPLGDYKVVSEIAQIKV